MRLFTQNSGMKHRNPYANDEVLLGFIQPVKQNGITDKTHKILLLHAPWLKYKFDLVHKTLLLDLTYPSSEVFHTELF